MQNQIPNKSGGLRRLRDILLKKSDDGVSDDTGEINADFIAVPDNNRDSDPFLHSLENLTADDIAPAPNKKKRTLNDMIYGVLRYAVIAVCGCVFVWSVYTILQSVIGYYEAESLYASLADEMDSDSFSMNLFAGSGAAQALRPSPNIPDFAASQKAGGSSLGSGSDIQLNVYNERLEKMKSKLNSIKVKNSDVYGWIKIENSNINYLIMQGEDNEYYLDHTFENNYLAAGSIFADYRNHDTLMKNFHVILYGHNMRNGMMFNNVMNYLDEKYFDENPYIEIYTFDGIYTYEVFAIYETRYDYDYIRTAFPNYDEFIAYCEKLRKNSIYEREGIEFDNNDRLLTLSTCTNNVTETGRYALHAKLVNVER